MSVNNKTMEVISASCQHEKPIWSLPLSYELDNYHSTKDFLLITQTHLRDSCLKAWKNCEEAETIVQPK